MLKLQGSSAGGWKASDGVISGGHTGFCVYDFDRLDVKGQKVVVKLENFPPI